MRTPGHLPTCAPWCQPWRAVLGQVCGTLQAGRTPSRPGTCGSGQVCPSGGTGSSTHPGGVQGGPVALPPRMRDSESAVARTARHTSSRPGSSALRIANDEGQHKDARWRGRGREAGNAGDAD